MEIGGIYNMHHWFRGMDTLTLQKLTEKEPVREEI